MNLSLKMYYNYNLLKKFININDDVENITSNLTLKSCEIEEIKERKIPREVVIGKVTNIKKHEQADKLFVCNIDCGDKGEFQIITGGENITEGYFVPVALVGCFLPELGFEITSKEMKGEKSTGMICSKSELGIKEDEDKLWIWLLDEDLLDINDHDLGLSLSYKFEFLDNKILDVENSTITNRPDLAGHFGLSIELNAIYNMLGGIRYNKIKDYINNFYDTNIFELLDNSNKSKRNIISKTEGLRSYILLDIDDVSVDHTSFLTRLLLHDSGYGSINNRVDFSNLFMNISGNPVHFFDADKIKGDVVIRDALEGESFEDLFGNKHNLTSDDIVISDQDKILALAGIVGSSSSGVDKNTKNIAVEIANFDPIRIRKTGDRLDLRTDSKIRFEKNINPLYTLYSLILFLDEIKFYSGDLGDFNIGGINYFYDDFVSDLYNKNIQFDLNNIKNFVFGDSTNKDIDNNIEDILNGLGFLYNKQEGYVNLPFWRGYEDINIKEDIYEEFSRVYGYENIYSKPMYGKTEYQPFNDEVEITRNIEEILTRDFNFNQVETYPWFHNNYINFFGLDKNNMIKLKNPVDNNYLYLRDNLLYNMLDILEKNFRSYDDIKIFDIGNKFSKNIEGIETYDLFMMYYKRNVNNWFEDSILNLKGFINELLKEFGIIENIKIVPTNYDNNHPRRQGDIYVRETLIGWIGNLHPIYYQSFKFPEKSEISYCNINIDILQKLIHKNKNIFSVDYETLQDQIVFREASFLLDKQKNFNAIFDKIKKINKIDDVIVFDIYSGENIPDNKKSISLSIKIRGSGNMKSDEINKILWDTIEEVENAGGELRK